jgi:hypothetical protein
VKSVAIDHDLRHASALILAIGVARQQDNNCEDLAVWTSLNVTVDVVLDCD